MSDSASKLESKPDNSSGHHGALNAPDDSVLAHAVSSIWRGDADSDTTKYVVGGLKTAALFLGAGSKGSFWGKGGVTGLAASAALYGLDRMGTNDDAQEKVRDFGLGALEGGATKSLFHGFGRVGINNVALKGVGLGVGNRSIHELTTPENYKDAAGNSSIGTGLHNVGARAFNPTSMLADAALFTVAHGMTRGANWLSGGAIDSRPLYNTVLTSGSFGLSSGAYNEFENQRQSGTFNGADIFKHALIQGGVDAVAGIPGGAVADSQFRSQPRETARKDVETVKNNVGVLSDSVAQKVDRVLGMLPGPEPALAMANGSTRRSGDFDSGQVRSYAQAQINKMDSIQPGADDHVVSGAPEPQQSDSVWAAAESEAEKLAAERKERLTAPKESTIEAKDRLDKAFKDFETTRPDFKETKQLYQMLRRHPELDEHVGQVYRNQFGNDNVRHFVEGFYPMENPLSHESSLRNEGVKQRFERLYDLMHGENERTNWHFMARAVKSHTQAADGENIDLRPVLEQVARTERGPYARNVIKAIDKGLSTKENELNYNSLRYWRTARPLPVPAEELRQAEVDQATVADAKSGTASKPRSDAPAPSEKATTAAAAAKEAFVKEQVQALQGSDKAAATTAAKQLADRGLPNIAPDTYFDSWRQAAAEAVPRAIKLSTPAGEQLDPAAVCALLRDNWSGAALGQSVDSAPTLARQIDQKLKVIGDLATAYEGSPQSANLLLRAGIAQPNELLAAAEHISSKNGDAYKNWLPEQLSQGQSLKDLVGETALNKANLAAAFADSPEVAQKLLDLAKEDPNFDLAAITRRLGHFKNGEEFGKLVKDKVNNNAIAEQLNADALWAEFQVRKQFGRTPDAVDKLLQLGLHDPSALTELMQAPAFDSGRAGARPPRGAPMDPETKALNFAYKDIIADLSLQATKFEDLQKVANALKSSPPELAYGNAFALAVPLRPQDPAAWDRVQGQIEGVAYKNAGLLPAKPRQERDDRRSGGGSSYPREQSPKRYPEDSDDSVVTPPVDEADLERDPDSFPPEEQTKKTDDSESDGGEETEPTTGSGPDWNPPYEDLPSDGPYTRPLPPAESVVGPAPPESTGGERNGQTEDPVAKLFEDNHKAQLDLLDGIINGSKGQEKPHQPAKSSDSHHTASQPESQAESQPEPQPQSHKSNEPEAEPVATSEAQPEHGELRLGERGGVEFFNAKTGEWQDDDPTFDSGPAEPKSERGRRQYNKDQDREWRQSNRPE